jgi:hypothetical protein
MHGGYHSSRETIEVAPVARRCWIEIDALVSGVGEDDARTPWEGTGWSGNVSDLKVKRAVASLGTPSKKAVHTSEIGKVPATWPVWLFALKYTRAT